MGTTNWYQFRTASCVYHAPRDQCSHDHNSTRITFHMNTIHLSLNVLHTKPHGWIQSLIGLKGQGNNIKKPLLSRHNRQGTVQSIAYPSRRKRPSNRHHIPVPPPPSLADEITRAEPMSTFNALANQLKKETNFYMKSNGIAVWRSLSGNQPNYSFSWQVLLSQVTSFPNRYIMELIMSGHFFQQYQQLHPRWIIISV